jgi:dihydrofolate reductase
MERISTLLMGSRSYLQILGFGDWAWEGKQTYVFTSQALKTDRNNIHFVHHNVKTFMNTFKKSKQKKDLKEKQEQAEAQESKQDIWLLGGAQLIKSFAQEKLIDECIITIIPKNIHEGIKLELPYENFTLVKTKHCYLDNLGIIQKFYTRKENNDNPL